MKPIRIIPRLDVKGHNLVKGVHLEGLRVLGVPENFSEYYCKNGADELLYIDMVASLYGRNNLKQILERTAKNVFIPITAGGGIRSVEDIQSLLRAGADKVAINTAAVHSPQLISKAAKVFGSQCIVLSVQAMKVSNGKYEVYTDTGRESSGKNVIDWIKQAVDLGAGEILITSIDQEGTGDGYDIDLISDVTNSVSVPVIACGGAGSSEHILDIVKNCNVDAVSAASIFHYDHIQNLEIEKRKEGNIEYLKAFKANGRSILKRINPVSISKLKEKLTESIPGYTPHKTHYPKKKYINSMKSKPVVTLVDYGRSNLFSVIHAFESIGAKVEVSDKPSKILKADKIVIAGVGAFEDGMIELNERRLIPTIQERAKNKKPILGICLGMQLFMDQSEEFGITKGLSLIRGKCVRLTGNNIKIPHIGWNQILYSETNNPIFQNVVSGSWMYFVHSYIVVPEDMNMVIAKTKYGQNKFCSAIRNENITGCQFHPEKSGVAGLNIYKNYIDC